MVAPEMPLADDFERPLVRETARRRAGCRWNSLARPVLRQKIVKARLGDDDAALRFIKPLRPRPGWPAPDNPDWLYSHALGYKALALPTRLAIISDINGGRLRVAEIRVRPSRMRFPDWGECNEPSITIVLRMVTTAPFVDQITTIGDLGLHSLARRIERARPNDDGAVLANLRALADGFRATIAQGGDFAIPTKSGGKWIGEVTALKDAPTLAVRTFVGD
jgi:hypothetical protein